MNVDCNANVFRNRKSPVDSQIMQLSEQHHFQHFLQKKKFILLIHAVILDSKKSLWLVIIFKPLRNMNLGSLKYWYHWFESDLTPRKAEALPRVDTSSTVIQSVETDS